MLITFYDSYTVLSKVYGGAFLKQAINDTMIRESSRAHFTKICYGVLDKDITLNYIISKLCTKAPKQAVKIILKIGLYSIIYLNDAPYAVTDTCVELAKKLGKGGLSGFINAILRNYLRSGIEYPPKEKGVEYYSVKYSYPEFLVKKLIKDYGESLAEEIMLSDTERTFVRFNTNEYGEKYLVKNGYNYELTPFDNCFAVDKFKMDDGFYQGIYTFQSVGSVAICDMVDGGNTLLDCCSAPGGKAVNLSSKFTSVIATELHSHRVELIKSYIDRMKKTNITALLMDSSVYNEEFNEKFDAVLCDAPCSGTGVIKDNPDIKLRRDDKNIQELSTIQLSILENVSRYVKKGGCLYYSTCSILNDENSKVIEKFLKTHQEFCVEETKSKLAHKSVKYGLQFLPHISMGAGFYFVKLRKNG